MQILRTKLALMRREYQEEETIAKYCEEVYPRRDVKTGLGIIEIGGRRTWTSLLLGGGRTAHKTPEHKGTHFPGMFFRFKPSQVYKKKENATKSTKASSVQSYPDTLT